MGARNRRIIYESRPQSAFGAGWGARRLSLATERETWANMQTPDSIYNAFKLRTYIRI